MTQSTALGGQWRQCDRAHSRRLNVAIFGTWFVAALPINWRGRGRSPGSPSTKVQMPRRRAQGRTANAGPALLSHRAGHRARRLRFPQRPGAALTGLKRCSAEVELHVHAPMSALGVRPAAESGSRRAGVASWGRGGMRPDVARLRPVSGKTGVVGHRLLVLRAGRIVFREGAPG
jgi:hypothetical protein